MACGIGTQSLGLAQRGFTVTASDLSERAIARARDEAARRGLRIEFSVCDMRTAQAHHGRQFDVVIYCDNSITHLLTYFFVDDSCSERLTTHVIRTRYNAIGTDQLLALMRQAGFHAAERLDGRFYQPVLVGNRDA